MAKSIQDLERIIANADTKPEIREMAQKALDEELRRSGSATVVASSTASPVSPELVAALETIKNALRTLSTGGSASVDITQLRQLVSDELNKRKINENDLAPDLKRWLSSVRGVKLSVDRAMNFSLPSSSDPDVAKKTAKILDNPLMQLILSDLVARNNVYLYGGAGTGKTFIAEQLAKLLGWEAIVLNCNQFTSPLDILGGQTIEGYQEGKLSQAWANMKQMPDGRYEPINGAVLILDELPKIDPNTAGILNQALAKVKDFDYDPAANRWIPPTIRNGKNEVLELKNLFIIATGNVALNTVDPDYEANFKQDLSLQDRFIGSTYKIFVDYNKEFSDIMKGYAFIWIFMTKVREKVVELRATGQAFVSIRVMINMRATYFTYRSMKALGSGSVGNLGNNAVSTPKNLRDSINSFFDLFKPNTRQAILDDVDINAFLQTIDEKDKMPFDPDAPNFDTADEIQEARRMIQAHEEQIKIEQKVI